jgi:hypothetical protein
VGRFFRPVAKARHFSTIEKNSRVDVSLLPQHWNPERAKLWSVVRMVAVKNGRPRIVRNADRQGIALRVP